MIVVLNTGEKVMKKVYEDILKKSFEKLLNDDYELLENNTHEITITNALSRYIIFYIQDRQLDNCGNISVDIEYNRMLCENNTETKQVSKAIYIISFEKKRNDLQKFIKLHIRPDIIIHQRKSNRNNILWLELKVNKDESECSFDMQKAWYAVSQLKYKLGISVLINISKQNVIFNWMNLKEVERVEFLVENKLLKEKYRCKYSYIPE